MKKVILLTLVVFSLSAIPCSARGNNSYIVMEGSSGRILCGENVHLRLPMASLTKIITALTVIENADLEKNVSVDLSCVGVEGSSMYLQRGETYSVKELLYGLMLVSGNDAAEQLALAVSESREEFAELMNQTAKKYGLENSHFVNPSGLDADGHYSSAFDLAKISAIALENPVFAEIAATKEKEVRGRILVNHNRLLRSLDGCIGVKTGYTIACGRCLVSAVKKEGILLVCVTLNVRDDWNLHKRLYEENLPRCKVKEILQHKEIYLKLNVVGGTDAGAYCERLTCVVIDEKTPDIKIKLPPFIYQNKDKAQRVGEILVYDDKTLIGVSLLKIDRTVIPKRINQSFFGKICDFLLHMFAF